MVDRALLRIDSCTTPLGTATNILDLREEFIMENDPRFVPNTYEGIGIIYNHEWHELILTFDSDTDIFDAYINDDGPNPVIPTFRIDLTMVVISTQTEVSERWTYTPSKVYVTERDEGRIEEGSEHQTFDYHLLAYDDRVVTFT